MQRLRAVLDPVDVAPRRGEAAEARRRRAAEEVDAEDMVAAPQVRGKEIDVGLELAVEAVELDRAGGAGAFEHRVADIGWQPEAARAALGEKRRQRTARVAERDDWARV